MNDRRTCNWYRRCAVSLALVIATLGCDPAQKGEPRSADLADVQPAPSDRPAPSVRDARHQYYRGYLADVLAGDRTRAQEHYQAVLGHGAEQPNLVAAAALRLARWAEIRRERRTAMDLAVRASVLGADTPRMKTAADALRLRLARTVRAQDIEVRGPRAGTAIEGVSPEIAAQFAAAEGLLGAYHRRRLQPRLEALVASVRGKRGAMERAVRAYREVIASGNRIATVAAEFRIASLHYDFSLSLTFELPGELAPEVAMSMRSSLRSEVRQVRARAKAAYARSLVAGVVASAEAKPWSEASSLGLASVEDLLRSGK
ncbi:MAG: hypothetical protein GY811_26240 [Myxococcales bacterium]|nr:hypothetical protein [Myxococcales bacterium]